MKKIFLLICWWMAFGMVRAQSYEDWSLLYPGAGTSKETEAQARRYEQTPEEMTARLDAYVDSVAQVDLKSNRIQGYRILIYSGNDREASNRSRESAYRVFSNADLYTVYKSPTFKVTMGNYHNRLEAYFAWKRILSSLPGAVIVPEIVFLKP